jgi:hypothetical protein
LRRILLFIIDDHCDVVLWCDENENIAEIDDNSMMIGMCNETDEPYEYNIKIILMEDNFDS